MWCCYKMKGYLASTTTIDWQHPTILKLALECAKNAKSDQNIAENCFIWVRDNIKHTGEFKLSPITCKASEVLQHKTGFCFAKSHLLCALLRANKIPSGLCYQCLSMDKLGAPYCLHGLNAVFLKESDSWYRIDARGNNAEINAQFCPPQEQLAFPISLKEEVDYHEVCEEPLAEIVLLLESSQSYQEVIKKLTITASIKPLSAIKVENIQ